MSSNDTVAGETCFFLKDAVEQSLPVLIANVITCILDALVFITAPINNAFIVYAIWTTSALYSPSNTLLCCLAVTDCLTGLIVAPLNIATKFGEMFHVFNIYCVGGILTSSMAYITVSVSFLTLALIAIERYLAVYLHLRYRTVITSSRIVKTIIVFWVFTAVLSGLRFVDTKEIILRPIVISILVLFLTATVFCYCKIYFSVQRHRRKIQAESVSVQNTDPMGKCDGRETANFYPNSAELARYRRSTLTMVYVVGFFLLCYSPTLAYQVLVGWSDLDETKTRIAYKYCFSVALVKSSVNPVLYCWRIADIRRVLRGILGQLRRTSPNREARF